MHSHQLTICLNLLIWNGPSLLSSHHVVPESYIHALVKIIIKPKVPNVIGVSAEAWLHLPWTLHPIYALGKTIKPEIPNVMGVSAEAWVNMNFALFKVTKAVRRQSSPIPNRSGSQKELSMVHRSSLIYCIIYFMLAYSLHPQSKQSLGVD